MMPFTDFNRIRIRGSVIPWSMFLKKADGETIHCLQELSEVIFLIRNSALNMASLTGLDSSEMELDDKSLAG
jgi:hypothetical protein